ncbi:putative alpha-glucosidase, partial [Saccoglossus kowalevskii]|uniref:Probable maltase D-like n=1 Tax=Saccoglossus kowalevskii TaxID=10224 RepID=A0ABM0GT43_SACKO
MLRFVSLSILVLCVIVYNTLCFELRELDWWQSNVIYQIYPLSFKDSDGNGTGDLNGITSRLDHFLDINVHAIWLSPVYESPMADFGYDISNFTAIDPIFGTMDDFDEMIAAMHDRGLYLIMDYVINHSSDQHEWFIESRKNKTNKYADYYMWYDAKPECVDDGNQPEDCPPSNWVSVFGGSMWEWEENRQQFYLHQFLKEQPDLNWRNQEVFDEMMAVVKFWLEKGVDGFRVDAIKHLFEVED